MLKRAILYLGMFAASTAGLGARPASATNYYFPPGQLSPQFKSGDCIYRIFYGNYGSTPFASARFYAGNCGPIYVVGIAANGDGFTQFENRTNGSGQDSCGPYFAQQATFIGPPAYGVAMVLRIGGTGASHAFFFDQGEPVRPYRYC